MFKVYNVKSRVKSLLIVLMLHSLLFNMFFVSIASAQTDIEDFELVKLPIVTSSLKNENFEPGVELPSFRYDHFNSSLGKITPIDIFIKPGTRKVRIDVVDVVPIGKSIAYSRRYLVNTGLVFAKPVFKNVDQLAEDSNESLFRRNPRKIEYDLKDLKTRLQTIMGVDYTVIQVKVRGKFPGIYTVQASADNNISRAKVNTSQNVQLKLVYPEVIEPGEKRKVFIVGMGFHSLVDAYIEGDDIREFSTTALSDDNLVLNIEVDSDAENSLRDLTIVDRLHGETVTLTDAIKIRSANPEIITVKGEKGEKGDKGLDGKDGKSFCFDPTSNLSVVTNNLPAGSMAIAHFDPLSCSLTFGIPVGHNGINGSNGVNGKDGYNGKGVCDDRNQQITVESISIAADADPVSELDSASCVLTVGIPEGKKGESGTNSLVHIIDELPGENCPAGGKKINTGLDLSNDGALQKSETLHSEYVCNGEKGDVGATGESGRSSLVNLTDEVAGINCASGGKKLDSGLDNNFDGILQAEEVQETEYICNGLAGENGAAGSDGKNSLINILDELAGVNCANGGKKVESGIDANNNSVLESEEISETEFVCNGIDGSDGVNGTNGASGKNSLVNILPETAGDNCVSGGQKIESGKDLNSDGVLQEDEVESFNYVCNGLQGEDGSAGVNSLVNVVDEPSGINCEASGKKIESGLDSNSNSFLDAEEVSESKYVCNGVAGLDGQNGVAGKSGLVNITQEVAGVNCVSGGQKVESGLDENFDGILQAEEVDSSKYVCNGIAGNSGSNSLVIISGEGIGVNCSTGGKKIEIGLDANGNNILDLLEISQTKYICNGEKGEDGSDGADGQDGIGGQDGKNSLVNVSSVDPGVNCETGGNKIEIGVDENRDDVLSEAEVDEVKYVCNGIKGDKGDKGDQGSQGEKGDKGDQGTQGEKGDKGDQGSQGEKGDKGDQGAQGEKGDKGDQGSQGEKGDKGDQGTQGEKGDKGDQGSQGEKGDKGDQGSQGEKGDKGDQGSQGEKGDKGDQGAQGEKGDKGEQGAQGEKGESGTSLLAIEELINNWNKYSEEKDFKTNSGAKARMVKIPKFIHDGIIYGGFWIDKYEASRADATSTTEGTSYVPVSKQNVVPWTSVGLWTAKSAAGGSGRQIYDLGNCHLTEMKEWHALYLLGRYAKQSGNFGATNTKGWNQRGNTIDGRDGRDSRSFQCNDDPTQNGGRSGRCLTGTGYKSWGHLLESTATKNPDSSTLPFSADSVKDTLDGAGNDTFNGDLQVYDLVGNVNEWIDFTATKKSSYLNVDAGYAAAGLNLPYKTNGRYFSFDDIASGAETQDLDFQGLGVPFRGSKGNTDDLNGACNDGVFLVGKTNNLQYGTLRGGAWTSDEESRSPLYLNISTAPTHTSSEIGFRVTCDE